MIRTLAFALGLLASLVVMSAWPARLAHAEPGVPVGATTDRIGLERFAFGLDLGITTFRGDTDRIALGLRFDLHAQALGMTRAGLVGGYVTLPLSRLSGDAGGQFEPGNLEAGGVYAPTLLGVVPVLFRAGLLLATADDSRSTLLINILSGRGRSTDLAMQIGGSTWVRVSASPLYRHGRVLARMDLGVDLPVDEPADTELSPLVRLNLVMGADLDVLALLAEVTTIRDGSDAIGVGEKYLHTLALTARATRTAWYPSGSLVLQVDESIRRDVALVVMLGMRYAPGLVD